MPATSKTVYLTRHGQAEHNVDERYYIRDAILTPLGQKQCHELNGMSKSNIQREGELIISSPLRRTMETMLLSYPELIGRLEKEGKPPILLDILQEVEAHPCDTPLTPIEELKNSRDGIFAHLDFSTLSPEYASKEGIFDPKNANERARLVRRWIRDRREDKVVVVAHGDILRRMIGPPYQDWDNCEVKVFTFESEDDEAAKMVAVPGKGPLEPKDATSAPTTGDAGR